MPILELHSIHKSFRRGFLSIRTPVLKGVDLTREPGTLYGFLGHPGAGKSTTMKIILGLLRPDSGHVKLFGEAGAGASLFSDGRRVPGRAGPRPGPREDFPRRVATLRRSLPRARRELLGSARAPLSECPRRCRSACTRDRRATC